MAKAFPLRTCDALIGITPLFRPFSPDRTIVRLLGPEDGSARGHISQDSDGHDKGGFAITSAARASAVCLATAPFSSRATIWREGRLRLLKLQRS
jgi:hypothetical protein